MSLPCEFSLSIELTQYGAKCSLELKALGIGGGDSTGISLFPSSTSDTETKQSSSEKEGSLWDTKSGLGLPSMQSSPLHCDHNPTPNSPVQGVELTPSLHRPESGGSEWSKANFLESSAGSCPRLLTPHHHAVVQPRRWLPSGSDNSPAGCSSPRAAGGAGQALCRGGLELTSSAHVQTLASHWVPGTVTDRGLAHRSWRSS